MSTATSRTATHIPNELVRKAPSRVEENVADDGASATRVASGPSTMPEDQVRAMRSDDAMAGLVIGGILTLAFSVLVAAMVVVTIWTIYATK